MIETYKKVEEEVKQKNKVEVELRSRGNDEVVMDVLQGAAMISDILMAAKRVRRMTDCKVVNVRQKGNYLFDLFRSGRVSKAEAIKMY